MTLKTEKLQEMGKYLEELTTSGRNVLDEQIMKKFKKICKQSEEYVKHAYHIIYTQLEKDHSEIRLSAAQMADELFQRSHCFRELLLADFQLFMELTLEINPAIPLPPPKPAAQTLKMNTQTCIQQWYCKFGDDYKKLSLGYNFLKNCKKVNFENIQAASAIEQQHEEERQQRLESIKKDRVTETSAEMTDTIPEIRDILIQIENLLQLLMPDPEDFNIHGLMSPNSGGHGFQSPRSSFHGFTSPNPCTGRDYQAEFSEGARELKSGGKGPKIKKSKSTTSSDTGSGSDRNETESKVTLLNKSSEITSSHKEEVKVKSEKEREHQSSATDPNVDCDEIDDSEEFQEISSGSDNSDDYNYDEDDIGMLSQYSQQTQMLRESGIGSQTYSLNIEIQPGELHLEETSDNTDLLRSLRDLGILVNNKYLPLVHHWLDVFTKMGGDQQKVKKAINIKQALEKVNSKIGHLKVKQMRENCASTSNVEDDVEEDEFEDVPEKEGYETDIPEHLQEEYGVKKKAPHPRTSRAWVPLPQLYGRGIKEEEEDPASYINTLKKLEERLKKEQLRLKGNLNRPTETSAGMSVPKQEKEKNSDLLERAPKVAFGTDLLHWGEKAETPLLVRYDSEHRFWTPRENEDVIDKNALESINKRVINFPGKFQPVKWKCRAPMPNGTLCPRMDRIKCPFHGKVIPRDVMGQPVDPKDRQRLLTEEEHKRNETQAWEDRELQEEIKAATGVDLRRSKKHGRAKKKYANLTDIKKIQNSTMKRLEQKVLNKRALSRVSAALSVIDSVKHRDKFANQFNYQLPQT